MSAPDDFKVEDVDLTEITIRETPYKNRTREVLQEALAPTDRCSQNALIRVGDRIIQRTKYEGNLWDVYALDPDDPDTWIWLDCINLAAYKSVCELEHDLCGSAVG